MMPSAYDTLKALGLPNAVLFDVKSILPLGTADGRLSLPGGGGG